MSAKFDKRRAEPDVIDNREAAMADVLSTNLPRIDSLDISSGYFDVGGYGLIREGLEGAAARDSFSLRLLIGSGAIRAPTFDTFEEYRRYTEDLSKAGQPHPLKADLDADELNRDGMDSVSGLIRLLRRDNVQVRHSDLRFNHAKCYILGQEGAIVGSSNFTRAGLSGNDELNAGIYNTATWEKIKAWYERMWGRAKDAKGEVLQVLEQSKFGVPAKPYEIYLKILFERYKRTLVAMAEKYTEGARTLAKFQHDAVSALLQIIDEYGGAMLADSTGLGKTHIALEVMRKKVLAEDRRALLIAPAQVRDTVWTSKLKEAKIVVEKIGAEELGGKDFAVSRYKRYDLIVIDESQNFRSSTANRRLNLMKILSMGRRKQVLLLSATPINNSIMDLYYQLLIIAGGRDDYFADIGIPDLYGYLRKAANHSLQDGLDRIQLLLDAVMVRRTRTFIKEAYPDGKLAGIPLKFPKRQYRPIRYSITDLFGNVYEDLLSTIKSLHMVPYGIERYKRVPDHSEMQRHAVLAHLQVILLLKRFESSIKAVSISIDNKIALFEYFRKVLAGNRIVSPKQLGRIMVRWNAHGQDGDGSGEDESRDEFFMREIEALPVQNAGDYDIWRMARDIDSDLGHLRRYKAELARILPFDRKADAVASTILKDGALEKESGKVLVFTEYTATAAYVAGKLRERFPEKRVLLITGSVKRRDRQQIIREFSPVSNLEEDEEMPERKADILVSTEVLSEGQNLQDCNYVINYDLPWNPMRIVQRIGRVDRLTSRHDTIRSRECFPDRKLDDLLRLVGKLMQKINDINDVVGLGEDLLGQEATPRQFNETTADRIRAFAGGDGAGAVAGELERESDLMPARSPINEISQHIRSAGIMVMEEFAMGRRSGKRGEGQKAILAYLQEKPHRKFYSVVFDYPTGEAAVVDDMEAITLARCAGDAPTFLPMDGPDGGDSFEQMLRIDSIARRSIADQNDRDLRLASSLQASYKKKHKQMAEDVQEIVIDAIMSGEIAEDEGEVVDAIMDSVDLRTWKSDIESLLDEYAAKKDARVLVGGLKRIGEGMDFSGGGSGEGGAGTEPGELVLVGAMFVSGEDFDPEFGIERFA